MTDSVLRVKNLYCEFRLSRRERIVAADNVSFEMAKGEIMALVGESGSGKSSVAKCIMNINGCKGEIYINDVNICDRKQLRAHRKELQTKRHIIFQDSASALNQRMTVREILREPVMLNRDSSLQPEFRNDPEALLSYVMMGPEYLDKRPPELSGGQRQRVAIARAMAFVPDLVIADEPLAGLDIFTQLELLDFFRHLSEEHGIAMLLIAHDLDMVRYISDRVCVMKDGKLVEQGTTREIFENPRHEYTKELLAAIPSIEPQDRGKVEI